MSDDVGERPHLSIGEVLSLLQEDFPDITISKIRFLESQGLLDPERTPSGYRKFYDPDISRLRWILYQQRENFLPLKIIKDRLSRGDVDFVAEAPPLHRDGEVPATSGSAGSVGSAGSAGMATASLLQEGPAFESGESSAPEADPEPAGAGRTERSGRSERSEPRGREPEGADDRTVSMTLEELGKATGLSARDIGELERFGMLAGRALGQTAYYDEEALEVARLAAAFQSHGIEARHLRMYKMAAQREVGVFEQLLLPLLRRRNAHAHQEATDLATELASLGDSMRGVLVRQELDAYLDRS